MCRRVPLTAPCLHLHPLSGARRSSVDNGSARPWRGPVCRVLPSIDCRWTTDGRASVGMPARRKLRRGGRRYPDDIWTVRIWTGKIGLGLGFESGLALVLGFGLGLVMTVHILTVQILTGKLNRKLV